MSFVNERTIKAVRKPHLCEACCKRLQVGEAAINWAGLTDGDFGSAYYHPECREAEIAYNHMIGSHYDEWTPLHDADRESYPWIKANHPTAYRRMLTPRARYDALAAAAGTAKTPKAVECEASQSGPNASEGNARPLSPNSFEEQ